MSILGYIMYGQLCFATTKQWHAIKRELFEEMRSDGKYLPHKKQNRLKR